MYRKLFILVLSLFIMSCGDGLTYEQKISNYNLYISKADSLFQVNDYEGTVRYANTAIAITDTLSTAFIKKGNACYELNWLECAEENFDKAIKIEGKTSNVYKLRALVHLKNNNSDFLDDINIYIKNHPKDEEAIVLRRDYFEEKDDFGNAIEEYSNAIKKDSENVDLYIKRGELYFKNGDYKNALEDYNTVLEFVPEDNLINKKKKDLEALMFNNQNRNRFIILLIGVYALYLPLSSFVLKPLVVKKAQNQIGGEFKIKLDPLVWLFPIVLLIIFAVSYYMNIIPTILFF